MSRESSPARAALAWLPNSLTTANLVLGFLSILTCASAARLAAPDVAGREYEQACWLILWAAIFDVLDGKVAKLTGATSELGMRLDTFADATTFGLAPSLLLYCAFLRGPGMGGLGWAAAGAYFLAASFRLARYNVQTKGPVRFGFTGLPTPAAAMMATTLFLSTRESPPKASLVAVLMVLLALVMVSPLRYPDFKGLKPRERNVVLALVSGLIFPTLFYGPAKVLFGLISTFALVWGYWWIPLRHRWVPGVMPEERLT